MPEHLLAGPFLTQDQLDTMVVMDASESIVDEEGHGGTRPLTNAVEFATAIDLYASITTSISFHDVSDTIDY